MLATGSYSTERLIQIPGDRALSPPDKAAPRCGEEELLAHAHPDLLLQDLGTGRRRSAYRQRDATWERCEKDSWEKCLILKD